MGTLPVPGTRDPPHRPRFDGIAACPLITGVRVSFLTEVVAAAALKI
jgi:hypothetical protein